MKKLASKLELSLRRRSRREDRFQALVFFFYTVFFGEGIHRPLPEESATS